MIIEEFNGQKKFIGISAIKQTGNFFYACIVGSSNLYKHFGNFGIICLKGEYRVS